MRQVQQFRQELLQLFEQNDSTDEVKRRLRAAYRSQHNPDGYLVGKKSLYQETDGTPRKANILARLNLIEEACKLRIESISAMVRQEKSRDRLMRKLANLNSLRDEIEREFE